MAAESQNTETEEDDVQWASQDAYREETADTDVVILPDGQMKMKISIMQPTRFASLINEYGMTDLARNLDDLPEKADLSDTGDVDLAELETDDLDELESRFAVILFFRDVIMPQIIKPEKVHWANPDHIRDPDWFDLSNLTDVDRTFLIGAVTGQDPDSIRENAQDRIESFPG